ncbi:MAG: hypothetical protein U5L76_03205 [Patescibacteria group bacterium]|nr:hypothetical protein [Patescibacteria group bacterium]
MCHDDDKVIQEAIERCQQGKITRVEVEKILGQLDPGTRRRFNTSIHRFHIGGDPNPYDYGP